MDTVTSFTQAEFLGIAAWIWFTFIGIVIARLAFDLGVLHKDDHEISVTESRWLSAGYISVALIFGAWVWWCMGSQSGTEHYTGFLIEKSLSMDHVFVIAASVSFGFILGGVLLSLYKTRDTSASLVHRCNFLKESEP